MSIISVILVGFFSAVVGAMGLGGGGVLLLYLSAFTNTNQLKAQGINLIFFVPIAVVSILLHLKNRLINKKSALFMMLGAVPSALLGAYLNSFVSQDILRKVLAAFLIVLGVKQIIDSFKKEKAQTT